MLRLCLTVPAIFSLVTANIALASGSAPRLVRAPVEKVYAPFGFDDNDNSEVVIHGHFPNTCYKTGPATALVDSNAKTITIDAQSYLYGGVCAQMVVPYIQ